MIGYLLYDYTATARTDSLSSHDTPSRNTTKTSLQLTEAEWNGAAAEDDVVVQKSKKQSTQIAKELSDIIIYVQVIYADWNCKK